MNKENYPNWLVPLDIAQELKAIGFDEPCHFYYQNDYSEYLKAGDPDKYHIISDSLAANRKNANHNKSDIAISAPTWTEVFAWFRKRGYLYGIENEIYYDFKNRNQKPKIKYSSYFETVGSGVKIHSCTSESYEEAREELVKDLIEIYIEELLE